jgi:alkyl hydroperoxide reductase subunit D
VLAVVRVASIVHAIGAVLDAERVVQPEAVAV